MKKIAVVFLFFFVYFPFAQMGENVYTFLNIPSNTRQASLGGDAISIRDNDVSQSINTPSLMNLEIISRQTILRILRILILGR